MFVLFTQTSNIAFESFFKPSESKIDVCFRFKFEVFLPLCHVRFFSSFCILQIYKEFVDPIVRIRCFRGFG